MSDNKEQCRAEFEAWHRSHFGWMECQYLPSGEYANGTIQQRYEVWQAARATPAQPVPVQTLLRELKGIGNSNRRTVGRQVFDMLALIEAFERKHPSPASDVSVPSPSSVGDAIRAMPLPGLSVTDGVYGFTIQQLRAFQAEAAALAEQMQGQQVEPQQFGAVHTIVMDGHQLKDALDLIAPDRDEDPDQLDDWLTFGVVKHKGDDGNVSTGLCCWNDDTDGVYPLHGETE